MNLLPRLTGILVAALLLAGCGQKGPLYLPGDPSQVQTEIPEVDREQLPPAAGEGGENDEDDDEN